MKRVSVKLKTPSVSGKAVIAIPRQVLPKTDKLDVVVAEIINPGHFYLQLASEYDKLNKMMDDLDLHYEPKVEKEIKKNNGFTPFASPTFAVGDYVAAVWATDQQWYRGIVKSLKQEAYEVFFFDYGDTVCVWPPYIWHLHEKFTQLPKQAIKAKLSGILPLRAYDEASALIWTIETTARMHQLTDQSHKSSLDMIVMDRGEEVLGVWLLDRQGEGVNETLVKEGFAQADEEDEKILPFFEETKTEEEEWEEEAVLLDRLHQDILKMDEMDEKNLRDLDIRLLSLRSKSLEIKYNNK